MMPKDGAGEVYPGLPIAVGFSRAMAPETIGPETIALHEEGGAVVPVAIAYDADQRSARLVPRAPLRPGATYRIAVGTGTRPTSTLGLSLAEPAEGRFTVAAAPRLAAMPGRRSWSRSAPGIPSGPTMPRSCGRRG